ncbi:MAG: ABC transporter ATP-binding protein [Nitrospirae bacterium]|nr:ABC transporter ATP-binding protein [Nitrospirota bacterium]
MNIAEVRNLKKTYLLGETSVEVLKDISLSFEEGDYAAIMGPSGSGKSTLLNLLGCLDRPSAGTYLLGGIDISRLSDDALSEIRSERIGFVFQSYNLISQLSVIENIEVPLFYQGRSPQECHRRSLELVEMVGLGQRAKHRQGELSGGERQRVAIARALANDPLIILADEPTGNLDSARGKEILNLMDMLNRQGKTIIMVTHEDKVAARAKRIVRLKDGYLEE